MTPEGIFMSITGLAPRPIEETPKDFRFLSIRASHFWIGVGELRRGRRPDLARDPHTECADGQDRRQRRLHGRVLLRIDRRQLRRRGFDGRRPALRQPGRGGELRGRACPCGRHQHDGSRRPSDDRRPPREIPTERSSITWERRLPAPRARRRSRSGRRPFTPRKQLEIDSQ